jgi:hypothetical protein
VGEKVNCQAPLKTETKANGTIFTILVEEKSNGINPRKAEVCRKYPVDGIRPLMINVFHHFFLV